MANGYRACAAKDSVVRLEREDGVVQESADLRSKREAEAASEESEVANEDCS